MSLTSETFKQQAEEQQLETCLIWQDGQIHQQYVQEEYVLHTIRPINSCTKSVVSLLCCIAMDKQLFPAPQERADKYFPQLKSLVPTQFTPPTIAHLLTLSVGFKWQEFGGMQSFPRMKRTPNWLSYLFQQPIVIEPGTRMCYNSGISQMLTTLLVKTTGMSVATFAEQFLFTPLNITDYRWQTDKQGVHTGGFGLYLSPLDMLKIGVLCVQEGRYNNIQIVSRERLYESVQPQLEALLPAKSGFYGWHWWIDHIECMGKKIPFYYARGYGGQFIFVVPAIQLVVVTTKDQTIKGELPLEWFKQSLLPSYFN